MSSCGEELVQSLALLGSSTLDKQRSMQDLLELQLAALQRVVAVNLELTNRLGDASPHNVDGVNGDAAHMAQVARKLQMPAVFPDEIPTSFSSQVSAESTQEVPDEKWNGEPVAVGQRVHVEGVGAGVVRFVGGHQRTGGMHVGVELDLPDGEHDGEVQGHRYFTCPLKHGVLVKPSRTVPFEKKKTHFKKRGSRPSRPKEALLVSQHPDIAGDLRQPFLRKAQSTADTDEFNQDAPKASLHGLFPNAEDIKERVRRALCKPTYSVEDFYSTAGCWQELARSETFKNTTFVVIFLNSIWIAIDTDYNKADVLCQAWWPFQVVENMFCMYFSFEIFSRFMAFERKLDCRLDGWFMFDMVLVSFMIWETWIQVLLYKTIGGNAASGLGNSTVLRIFRLFRLTRVARLARLLHSMPELMYLVKGMMMAVRSVFSTLFLMIVVIYVFAILFTQLLSHDPAGKDCFENVPQAMNCLLIDGVFTDQGDAINKMLEAGPVYYVFMLLYLLIGSCTVMNMLIGVLCEVVGVVAQVEKEQVLVETTKEKLFSMLPQLDADGDCKVSKDEFLSLLESPDAVLGLSEVDVDVEALVDYTDYIFEGADELGFTAFMETVFQFRGSNNATVKDLVDIRKFLTKELAALESRLHH
mmetsp:Transcript_88887/g.250342  ORF Transcript_88887/g.250342 Transcript_88887/m.250342 type:complete len:641 (-) Transcript_88887:37-1959(-)